MNHLDHIKEWKLYRAIYDEMGLHTIEGERPQEEFEKLLANTNFEWIIGYKPSPDYTTICVVLEGNKEVLECVLKLIHDDETR